jgi:Cys-tRNA(Pro) deacylase
MSVDYPITQAIRVLRAHQAEFTPHLYDYLEKGGTAHSAACLGVDEHSVIKTIVFQDDKKRPLICLQHGDLEISTKSLARILNVKSIVPCAPEIASKHTGYLTGGTSPLGLKKSDIPIYYHATILGLSYVFINGGKRGFLVRIKPKTLVTILNAISVDVST